MSEVEVLDRLMDPALKKLLEDLPLEDPDREWATVWTTWTEGEYEVPVNEWVMLDFGTWYGPQMAVTDITLHVRYKASGNRSKLALDPGSVCTIYPMDGLAVRVCVTV